MKQTNDHINARRRPIDAIISRKSEEKTKIYWTDRDPAVIMIGGDPSPGTHTGILGVRGA